MKQFKVIVIGAGGRGSTYSWEMAKHPDWYEIVAVAEPVESKRKHFAEKFNIPENMQFTDYNPLFKLGKIADIALIATMDRDHYDPTMKAISLKYDILLEKPVSPNPKECYDIANYAEKMGVKILVCHVLRYSQLFITLKNMIMDGKVGDIISVNHEECVGNIHQSHSFVRGNWGNSTRSSFMLLQKSCHDMDILQWLIGKKCKKLQSFGTLSYFTEKNAPEGAPEFCVQGCPIGDKCPYNAEKIYYDKSMWFRPSCIKSGENTDENIKHIIETTNFGRCVFKCDNDVVDHQTVNMLFEDDVTVTFTMNAFNKGGRFIHIMGTKGEIRAATDGETPISYYNYETKETTVIDEKGLDGIGGGHGGGDAGIITTLYEYMCGTYKGYSVCSVRQSCDNHLIVFAAEESRKKGTVIDFDEFVKSLNI